METTNGNKIALAVLGALLGTMVLGVLSNAIFSPQKPATPGYSLPGAEAAGSAAPAAAAAPAIPLPELLAKADPAKGANDAKACEACHNFEKGGGAKVGPPLWGVVGRPVASIAGFAYSDALNAMGGDWTYEKLNEWITKPSALASGTKMAFPGESDAAKRADILAFLQKQSDSPVPFPQVAAAAPAAAATPAPAASTAPAPAASATPAAPASPATSAPAPAPAATPATKP
jgi:cytochrome c